MLCHTISNLKVCDECFVIHHNLKTNDSRSRFKECFNLNIIEDEVKRDFKISKINGIEMAPNCFYGFYQQLDEVEQHEVIYVDSGSAEMFVINVDPDSESFGSHQRIILWKGGSIYVAPRHLFGICATKKGFRGKVMFGAPYVDEHYYGYGPISLQEHNEKFLGYDYDRVQFVGPEQPEFAQISMAEIAKLITTKVGA